MDMNGKRRRRRHISTKALMMYTTGAWLRHGFHEDGFHTGIHAAKLALGDRCGQPGARVQLEFPIATKITPLANKRYNASRSLQPRD